MTREQKELFDAIRKRFVGTGEEHDLLAKLASEYGEAYDKGVKFGQSQAEHDADAIQFARTLCSMTYGARHFIENCEIDDEYTMQQVAIWLKSVGKTPAILRQIADEMEKPANVE